MSNEKSPQVPGQRVVVAIEKMLLQQLKEAEKYYHKSVDELARSVARDLGLNDPGRLLLLLRFLRRSPRANQNEISEAVLNYIPEAPILKHFSREPAQLAAFLMQKHASCGWYEVTSLKVRRSNIHTVLKTLDPIWQESVDDTVLQQPRESIRSNSEELLSTLVDAEVLRAWLDKVLFHFANTLVFANFEGSNRKPAGTISAEQFRTYKANWSNWCKENYLRILEVADRLMPEELDEVGTRFYTQGKPSRSDKMAMEFRKIMRQEMHGLAVPEFRPKWEKTNNEDLRSSRKFRVSVSLKDNESLQAEKVWTDRKHLESESGNWLDAILSLWEQPETKIMITYEANDGVGTSKIVFEANSAIEALSKLNRLVTKA